MKEITTGNETMAHFLLLPIVVVVVVVNVPLHLSRSCYHAIREDNVRNTALLCVCMRCACLRHASQRKTTVSVHLDARMHHKKLNIDFALVPHHSLGTMVTGIMPMSTWTMENGALPLRKDCEIQNTMQKRGEGM